MALKIVLLVRARNDIASIESYIQSDNPDAAARLVARIRETISQLSEFPGGGIATGRRDTRQKLVPASKYLVFYRVRGGDLQILRVIHGARIQ